MSHQPAKQQTKQNKYITINQYAIISKLFKNVTLKVKYYMSLLAAQAVVNPAHFFALSAHASVL